MIPLADAQAHVMSTCRALDPVDIAAADARGLVLAQDVVATELVPPFANTGMDGYAVRAADTGGASESAPVRLAVVDELPAGRAPERDVGDGEAIRIMTGAPIPEGADAIVMVERTHRDGDDGVLVEHEAGVGDHIRAAGGDLAAGSRVFATGTVLRPAHVGLLASIGASTVRVHPRPRVGVLSTGDELVEGPQALAPGQIRDSNRRTLLALVAQAGAVALDLGRAPDDEASIEAALRRGVDTCDALLTSGGVSMGDFDYVKVVLDRMGDMKWMQVAIRPAKPLAFGTVERIDDGEARRVPVFGLPGNPVSSVVSFELFARPALRKMMGHRADDLDRPRVLAVADEALRRRPDGKVHFARVVATAGADGREHVRSAGGQGSHQLSALVGANALAVLPDGDGVVPGGDVEVLLTR